MKNISFTVDYETQWGQKICVCGSIPELGAWDESMALGLDCLNHFTWSTHIETKASEFQYYYLLKEGGRTIRREWGTPHPVRLGASTNVYLLDFWRDLPSHNFLHSSAFAIWSKKYKDQKIDQKLDKSVLIKAFCPLIGKNETLVLCGESEAFGYWQVSKSLQLDPCGGNIWQIVLDASLLPLWQTYKLAICNKQTKEIRRWESEEDRVLHLPSMPSQSTCVVSIDFRYSESINWKAAGVAIPVFSLRSEDSYGIGEFSDLKKMVDWTLETGQKIIQILPINDTTATHKWTDSYPYNAISIYALHPIYLGLKNFPLTDKDQEQKYREQASVLNELKTVDYEQVMSLKMAYLKDLYREAGVKTLASRSFKTFFDANQAWLFPYACFCYFRDLNGNADHSQWGEFSLYNKMKLEAELKSNKGMLDDIQKSYFIQYLLHAQLADVKKYANAKGIVLKGDIPIGINRNSVEAWTEPHLFHLDTQTGAPPDDFSVTGQNWGFPTYNWDEMAKDNYYWWTKRFRKMADYFYAYRIDHILGFFRIWEIPQHSVQGLLGYFSPAMPLSVSEITNSGVPFDEQRMTTPYIHDEYLQTLFNENTNSVIATYLNPIEGDRYELKEHCNTQIKIKALFENKTDVDSKLIKQGLFALCNEVLFVRDKSEPHKFHPRITAQQTYSFRALDENVRQAFNDLYNFFFYYRHSQFWKEKAMEKLPSLISSTQMLVCGEDLGMIPSCVPEVMRDLQILSLEIQRMPKTEGNRFDKLDSLPYNSVCTSSTHDMSPIRTWWETDREAVQVFYNEVLNLEGKAPKKCGGELCMQIIKNHLQSTAMLTILPLQDWLSMDEKLRRSDPKEEQINVPSNPRHYWQYRMHLNIEDLLKAKSFNTRLQQMIAESGRT